MYKNEAKANKPMTNLATNLNTCILSFTDILGGIGFGASGFVTVVTVVSLAILSPTWFHATDLTTEFLDCHCLLVQRLLKMLIPRITKIDYVNQP